MLSYQHAYHAGNAADVVKHALYCLLLQHFTQKPKGFMVYETHAGRGVYDLTTPEAQKTGEFHHGINLLRAANPTIATLQPYLKQLTNTTTYLGSPALAAGLTRAQDVIQLAEAHPQEVKHLRQWAKTDRRIVISATNGHTHIPSLLPSPTDRALVLIDPSYEVKEEYLQVVDTVRAILHRAPKTTIMVWYPLLATPRHAAMVQGLTALGVPSTTRIEVTYAPTHNPQYGGMQGSGQIILGTPFGLSPSLQQVVTTLATILHQPPSSPPVSPTFQVLVPAV